MFDYKLGCVDGDCRSALLVGLPLISLIDQVVNLKAVGVSASVVTSGGGIPKALLASEND